MKILMVCLGNICRSPMAEGIMRHKITEHHLTWEVDSAGTGAYHTGQEPDPRAQHILKSYNIDISKQRARKFTPSMFAEYDLIFTMDAMNYNDVLRTAKNKTEADKVQMIMNMVTPGKNTIVPDPYFDDTLYTLVYDMLNTACDAVIKTYTIKNN